jgi:RNA polymerase sigma factor (sigma-70 family)
MSALSTRHVTPTCADNELVAAVRRGSDRAFEELYSRYRGRIGAYILGIVRDHARAEDIAQEVFISALRRLRETDRPIAFKAWIYEIAKNACIDEFRRTRRAREVPLEPEDEDADGESRLPSTGPTPDAAVESKQALDDLRSAFHGLSESHHKIIVMREFEGLSYSQIGERLGVSRPVVESTLFRARRRLGKEYDELVSGRRCEHVQTLIAAGEPKSLLKLGLRERRQLARHLSHCQPCRREARLAGIDDSLFHAPGIAGKIAALLPIPWLRWRRGDGHRDAAASAHSHSFALMQPLQSFARFADLVDPSTVIGRVAAAAAAVALAGLGGGVVVAVAHHESAPTPRSVPAARSRSAVVVRPPARHTSSARPAAASRPNSAVRSTPASGATGHRRASTASGIGAGRGASSPPARGASPSGSSSAGGGTPAHHGSAGGHSLLGLIPHSGSGSTVHVPILQKVTKPLGGVVKKVTKPVGGVVQKVTKPLGGVVKKVTSAPPVKLQLPQIPQKVSVPGVGTVSVPKVSVPNPSKLLSP